MKILFIGPSISRGGGVGTAHSEVVKVVRNHKNLISDEIITSKYVKGSKFSKLIGYLFMYFLTIFKTIWFNPKVIYSQTTQSGYFHQTFFLFLGKLLGKKTIAHFHAKPNIKKTTNKININLILFSQKYIDCIVVLTSSSKKNLQNLGWNKPIYIVQNFIDVSYYPKKLKDINEREYILYIGRMHEKKGIFEILQIANILKEYKFLFIGGFENKESKKIFLKKAEKSFNVIWLGPIFDYSKFDYIKNSKILIFPTQWKGEVFPLTIIESSIFGVIPFVSPVGSIPNIIKNGYNGFFIGVNSPEITAKKIKGFLNNHSLVREISKNCRNNALKNYTAQAVNDKIINIFKSI